MLVHRIHTFEARMIWREIETKETWTVCVLTVLAWIGREAPMNRNYGIEDLSLEQGSIQFYAGDGRRDASYSLETAEKSNYSFKSMAKGMW